MRKHSFQGSFQHGHCDTDFKYESNPFSLYAHTVYVLGLKRVTLMSWALQCGHLRGWNALNLICWGNPCPQSILTHCLWVIKLDTLYLYCCRRWRRLNQFIKIYKISILGTTHRSLAKASAMTNHFRTSTAPSSEAHPGNPHQPLSRVFVLNLQEA